MSVVRKLRDKKGVDQELEALVAQALIEILVATLGHRTPPCLGVDRGSRRPERATTPRRACLRVPTVLSSRLVFPSGPEDIRAHLLEPLSAFLARSEERRVGTECVSPCRSRGWRYH